MCPVLYVSLGYDSFSLLCFGLLWTKISPFLCSLAGVILLIVPRQSLLIKKTVVALVTPAGPSGWVHSSHVLLHLLQAAHHHLQEAASASDPFGAPLCHLQVARAARQFYYSSCVKLLVVEESPVVSEPAAADGACVCVWSLVHVHVRPQVLISSKTLVTLFTLIRTQFQMICDNMVFQSESVGKSFSTFSAYRIFGSGYIQMNPIKVWPQKSSVNTTILTAWKLAYLFRLMVFLHVTVQIFHSDINSTLCANSQRLIPVKCFVGTFYLFMILFGL